MSPPPHLSILLVLAVLLPLAPPSAAQECYPRMLVWSGVGGIPLNPVAAACATIARSALDGQVIVPGATEITVRLYTNEVAPSFPLSLHGLGFASDDLTLAFLAEGNGTLIYSSGALAIPDGPAARGTLTASTLLGDGTPVSIAYRTVA